MKNLTLIVDIGNTTTVFGVFSNDKFIKSLTTFTHKHSQSEKSKIFEKFVYENDFDFSKGMIFTVVPHESENIKKLVKSLIGLEMQIFNPKTYDSFKTTVDNPKEVGADLIADVVAANTIYGAPNLVVDLGTVNKILLSNKDGVFEGCSFFPGLQTSLSLFNEKTALLPELNEFKKSSLELGKNTIDAMNHGVYWSVVSFIRKVQSDYPGDVKLILTGGNCTVIEGEIENKICDPDLTVKGMNKIFMELEDEL